MIVAHELARYATEQDEKANAAEATDSGDGSDGGDGGEVGDGKRWRGSATNSNIESGAAMDIFDYGDHIRGAEALPRLVVGGCAATTSIDFSSIVCSCSNALNTSSSKLPPSPMASYSATVSCLYMAVPANEPV